MGMAPCSQPEDMLLASWPCLHLGWVVCSDEEGRCPDSELVEVIHIGHPQEDWKEAREGRVMATACWHGDHRKVVYTLHHTERGGG